MQNRSHRFLIVFGIPLAVLIGLWFYATFVPVISQKPGAIYNLRVGISKRTLVSEFSQQKILSHPHLFSLYIIFKPTSQLKAGEYLFKPGSTFASIWQQMTTGTGYYYRPFMIVPGRSFKEIRQKLQTAEGINLLTQQMNDQQIMLELGYPNFLPEGEFFPETYYYTRGTNDLVILKNAFLLMQEKLSAAWQKRAKKLPYKNQYEALIAASLIEKEAYLAAERPLIASVLINRMNQNMLLQFDPTVIYGMGNRYNGAISKKDLKENTPYNTYVHEGLPPTPIAMPSLASIEAALHPASTNYLYFVAKEDGSGGHQFSKTLEEHYQAVLKANERKRVRLESKEALPVKKDQSNAQAG